MGRNLQRDLRPTVLYGKTLAVDIAGRLRDAMIWALRSNTDLSMCLVDTTEGGRAVWLHWGACKAPPPKGEQAGKT